jgi:hypothetical protein
MSEITKFQALQTRLRDELQSLEFTFTFGQVNPSYFYTQEEYDEIIAKYGQGEFGWTGSSGISSNGTIVPYQPQLTPEEIELRNKKNYMNISITLSNEFITKISELLQNKGIYHVSDNVMLFKRCNNSIDNGTAYFIKQRLLRIEQEIIPEVLVKKPWFDRVLSIIREYDQTITESTIINDYSGGCYECDNDESRLMIENYTASSVKSTNVYDEENKTITLCIMYNSVDSFQDELIDILKELN